MINRAKMPRQLRNKGGIMTIGGGGYTGKPMGSRTGFGFIDKVKDRFRKLIPNELADVAVKAAPFVAPFNPGIAALMRGIGRFDQRGSISDALKQGVATFGFGKAAGFLGGAKGPGGIFGKQTFTKEGFRQGPVGRLFQGKTPGEPKVNPRVDPSTKPKGIRQVANVADKVFEKGPAILKDLSSEVKQKLLVGGITSGASALYSYYMGEFEPQQPGETVPEYMARRRERVKAQVRQTMDSYYTPLRNPEYAAMSDEEKDNFIDGIVGSGMATGGRVGYQTGGITMANTLAENIRRNLANQAAVAQQFRQARANIPGYVEPVVKPVQQSAQVMDPTRMIPQTSTLNPDLEQAIKNARAAGRNEEYIDTMLKERQDDQAIDFFKNLIPAEPPKKVIPVEPGPGGIDNLLPDLYEKVIGPAEPPKKIIPEDDMIFRKLPVEPDPDTPIDELVKPIMPTLPVEPMTDQQILEGYAKYKQENPEAGMGVGIQVIINGVLPDGTPLTFRNGAEAAAFNQYLASIGQPPFRRVSEPISKIDDSKEKSLSKLAKGGMPVGIMRTNKAGVMERDYRDKGGFVPVGIKEKADDVPAMLSKNEFVFTADAVRGAGGGSIEKGAQKMYDTMKKLEKRVV